MADSASSDPETLAWLLRSRDFLAEKIDRPVKLEEAAQEACLSPFYYHRLFVRQFGMTPHEFRTQIRLDEARRLLVREEMPVSEICLQLGYSSLGSFSSLFSSRFGIAPSEYRRGARRFFAVHGYRGYRFVPTCFIAPPHRFGFPQDPRSA